MIFKMEYDQVISIPGGLNTVETYSFVINNLNTNFKTLAATYNVSTSAAIGIRPGLIQLTDPLGQIDFLKAEKISLLASKANFTDEKEIGYLDPVPLNSVSSTQLFPTLVDGTDIFTADKFNLRLKIKWRGVNSSSSNLRLRVNMNVVDK